MPVPQKWAGQDRKFGETLKNNVDVLAGFNGDPLDRAITARDLLDSGIARLAVGSITFSGGSNDLIPTGGLPTYGVPPAPTNLTADGGFEVIILTWDLERYEGHSYVEVYRHTSDVIADATLNAQVSGRISGVYSDPVEHSADFYYWVRAVNENGVAGPFNSSTGTRGQSAPDVDYILDILANSITSSQLAQDLTTQLAGYDTDIAALETTFGATASAATSAASAAASESAAIAAKTAALLAQSNAETAEDNAVLAETNAETAQSGAETAQTAASQSATGAAGSASSASQSATTSANSATAAGASATAAATSETNAATYATNAGTSSTASQTSRLAAEAAETNAATSATAAATSATTASASQTAASQSASVANTNKIAAETARSGAETAETNAASSETNASGSASSASTSATNAANSATAAGNSASAANTSAQTASTQASNAGTSASAASASQTAASTSATNAANSAGAASTSATTAAASESAAGQSAATATTQANTATTKAGQASTFASNAATSESNAAGSASAASSTVNGLTARLNNAGGTGVTVEQQFTANANSLGELEGQYTVKIDANGAVAGFGLASTTTSLGATESEFYVNADRFAIMQNGSNNAAPSVPFSVVPAGIVDGVSVPQGVYITDAFIRNGTIVTAMIGNATITDAKITTLNAEKITTGSLETARLNLDGTTLSVNAAGELVVNAINANQITAGTINASIMSGTTVYADKLTGDVSKLLPFRSTAQIPFRGNAASGGGVKILTTQQLPASTHPTGHKAFASVTGWYDSTANKTYSFRLYMQDTAGSSQSLGTPYGIYLGYGSRVVQFSGNKTSLVQAGQTITATGKSHPVTAVTYNSSGNTTSISYGTGSGGTFTTSDSVTVSASSAYVLVGETRFKANTSLYAQFALSGSLTSHTTGVVNMKLEVTRTGTSGINSSDTSTATDIVSEVSGFMLGAR
jgi:chemotaxis protein histidine kinase CheA